MKKNFTRIVTIVLAICALTAMAIPSSAAWGGSMRVYNGKPTNVVEEVAKTYTSSMLYARNNIGYPDAFADPHEAWTAFMATKSTNIYWFRASNHDNLYNELKASLDRSDVGKTATVWKRLGNTEYYHATVWYDAYVYVTENFGHPTYLCNLDNPYTWDGSASEDAYWHYTRDDLMYTGTYSEEIKTMIQNWWDTMDEIIAYMASRGIDPLTIGDYNLVYAAADDFVEYKQNGGTSAPATPAAPAAPSTPATGTSVTVNGKDVTWTDAEPFIDANSRTMVPLRAVADAMGLDVNWDGDNREASFTDGSKTIYFPIDVVIARTSDGGTITMDTAAIITDGRTYAPIRYLAEYFGYTVGWDADTHTVVIS